MSMSMVMRTLNASMSAKTPIMTSEHLLLVCYNGQGQE